MNSLVKLTAAAAAVIVLAVVGWNLLPGRSGAGAQSSPTPGVTVTPGPSASTGASPTPIACEDGIQGCAGTLEAGAHQTSLFTPGFEYSTPAGWDNPIDTQGLFTLWPQDSVYATPGDLVMVWSNVVPADRPASCELGAAPGAANSVSGWVAYLRNHPGVIVTNERSINLGGSIGRAVDLETNPAWVPACAADAAKANAPLVTTPGGGGLGDGYGIGRGARVRLYAIGVGNQTVVITVYVYGSPDQAAFSAAADLAEGVIDTFSWVCKADSPAGPCWGPPDASGNPATPPPSP
ncbi:MAG: hypothetical protein HYX57_06990 [Chloroflexi bacterium]|nr:hypothetical protein [Chloroflexota bacterium]